MHLFKIALEIFVLYLSFYCLISFVSRSSLEKKAFKIYTLFSIILLPLLFLALHFLKLHTLEYLLRSFFPLLLVLCLLIFQNEVRIGVTRFLSSLNPKEKQDLDKEIDELLQALSFLIEKRIGAILAIEREVSLASYMEQGIELDAKISHEIICTIFMPGTPLHDGGIVIQKNRIRAASCIFPLSQRILASELGTRHRAAIGLSEITDALIFVVSEERKELAICFRGEIHRKLSISKLEKRLKSILKDEEFFEFSEQFAMENKEPEGTTKKEKENENVEGA